VPECTIQPDQLDVFAEACVELGAEFMRDQTSFAWFGRWVNDYHGADAAYRTIDPATFGTCAHAVRVPGATYEVGLVKMPDGTFRLMYDNWSGGGGLHAKLGKQLSGLRRTFATRCAERQLRREGRRTRREIEADGTTTIVVDC
jgi:hypothetical protein